MPAVRENRFKDRQCGYLFFAIFALRDGVSPERDVVLDRAFKRSFLHDAILSLRIERVNNTIRR